ncbi:MAG TPA: SH3 domain-containing protein [Candidatus Acidoferrales bacterium]|nr:SH3 domain-containing protein [Candidatus Acidoferrales bacterium]
MRRRLIIAIPLLTLVAVLAWVFRPKHEWRESAYVIEGSATVYNNVAQVRQAVATVHYGEKVEVLGRRNENTRVRTAAGATGWMDGRMLMEPTLWKRSAQLLTSTRNVPVQARGRTKVSTILRVEPGRTATRLYKFGRGVPVEVAGRAVADWVQFTEEKGSGGEPQETKKEEWFLVRGVAGRAPGDASAGRDSQALAETGDPSVPIAGWVVARFIELNPPGPVREGMASTNMRALAWFELNRAPDPSGTKPQYLVAGARGPEGRPCDFSTLRFYTWNAKRSRYETAFIENKLCGALPILLDKGPNGEPQFRFHVKDGDKQERVYRLLQTVVRRVRENEPAAGPRSQDGAKRGAH